jgi:hypothetical protein
MMHLWSLIAVHASLLDSLGINWSVEPIAAVLLTTYLLPLILHAVVEALPHEFIDASSRSRVEVSTADDANIVLFISSVGCIKALQLRQSICHELNLS